jgi:hypothetical protein
MCPVAELRGDRRPPGERLRAQVDQLPVRQLAERALNRPGERSLRRTPLEHDEAPLLRRLEQVGVDALLDDAVLAGEALRRGMGRFRRRCDQGVDPGEQLLASGLRGRVAEPLGREEAGHGQRVRVPEGEVRQARQARLEAVDDVELAPLECRGQVRAHPDREADAAPTRDGHGGTERDQRRPGPVSKGAPPGGQVGGAVRGGEHAHRMVALAERIGDPGDVLVHVVRLRPREGGHQADSQGHDASESSAVQEKSESVGGRLPPAPVRSQN